MISPMASMDDHAQSLLPTEGTTWDPDRTFRELLLALRNRDDHRLERAVLALDRLDCWRDAIGRILAAPKADNELGVALLSCWITWGFHIAASLKGDLILVDALRHLLPPYSGPGLRLYRGELELRHRRGIHGIAWTPKLDVAKMFANRRHPDGIGVVLQIEAAPDAIVAGPGSQTEWLGEIEYIIDPRLMGAVREIE